MKTKRRGRGRGKEEDMERRTRREKKRRRRTTTDQSFLLKCHNTFSPIEISCHAADIVGLNTGFMPLFLMQSENTVVQTIHLGRLCECDRTTTKLSFLKIIT